MQATIGADVRVRLNPKARLWLTGGDADTAFIWSPAARRQLEISSGLVPILTQLSTPMSLTELVAADGVAMQADSQELEEVWELFASHGVITPLTELHRQVAARADPARSRVPLYFLQPLEPMSERWCPYPLGMVRAMAEFYDAGALNSAYDFRQPILASVGELFDALEREGPGIILMSTYDWLIDRAHAIARAVKEVHPGNVVIFGGHSVPVRPTTCQAFLDANRHVDILVRGEAEHILFDTLSALAGAEKGSPLSSVDRLSAVKGLAFRASDHSVVVTEEAGRIQELDPLPSPYLTGVMDDYGFHGDSQFMSSAVLETNRGCPYQCVYCDWGAGTGQKIKQFSLERVREEVRYIARRKTQVLLIADANFGIFDRDVEIAKMIADAKREFGYPKELSLSLAKNATERIFGIADVLKDVELDHALVVALQTVDKDTLKAIRRSNIQTERLEILIDRARTSETAVNTDIILALPGQTLKSWTADLQYCFSERIGTNIFMTKALINAPISDPAYQAEHSISLLPTRYISSTATMSAEERRRGMKLATLFRYMDGWRLGSIPLMWLQRDHQIPCGTVLHKLLDWIESEPERVPAFAAFFKHAFELADADDVFSWESVNHNWLPAVMTHWMEGWGRFFEDWRRVLTALVPNASAAVVASVLAAQEATLPARGKQVPAVVALAHDVATWLSARSQQPLSGYGSGTMSIGDPRGVCALSPPAFVEHLNGVIVQSREPTKFGLDTPVAAALLVPRREPTTLVSIGRADGSSVVAG